MRTRSTYGEGFSSVSGGVKGGFTKLEGGVMLWFCVIEACDVDIAARCTASRSCTRVIARTGRGNRSQLSPGTSLTQQHRFTAAKSDNVMIRPYVRKGAPSGLIVLEMPILIPAVECRISVPLAYHLEVLHILCRVNLEPWYISLTQSTLDG